jgi:hypothetical protein
MLCLQRHFEKASAEASPGLIFFARMRSGTPYFYGIPKSYRKL